MEWAKLKVSNKGGLPRYTKVELNGVDVTSMCHYLEIRFDAKEPVDAVVALYVSDVELDTDALLEIRSQDEVGDSGTTGSQPQE